MRASGIGKFGIAGVAFAALGLLAATDIAAGTVAASSYTAANFGCSPYVFTYSSVTGSKCAECSSGTPGTVTYYDNACEQGHNGGYQATCGAAASASECTSSNSDESSDWAGTGQATLGDEQAWSLSACQYPAATLPGSVAANATSTSFQSTQLYAALNGDLYETWDLCGACCEITDESGLANNGKTVTVMITDECPAASNADCTNGYNHIDLSYDAFTQLESKTEGIFTVDWQIVPCPTSMFAASEPTSGSTDMVYTFKGGSSSGWAALMIRDNLIPIQTVDFCTGASGTGTGQKGSGCSQATWQYSYNSFVGSGTWNTFYVEVEDMSSNWTTWGPITAASPMTSCSTGPDNSDTVSIYKDLGGQMVGCGPAGTNTASPTPSPNYTHTATPTASPTPADCAFELASGNALNDTWGDWVEGTGGTDVSTISLNTTSTYIFTPATASIKVAVSTPSTWMGDSATFLLNSAMDWTNYDRITLDVYVASALSGTGTTYGNFAIAVDGGSTTLFYSQDPTKDGTVTTQYPTSGTMPLGSWMHMTFPLNWSTNGLSPTQITRLHVVPNVGTPTAGTFYIDNVYLHTDKVCPTATPTPTNTPVWTPTPTYTATPDCPLVLSNGGALTSSYGTWSEGVGSDTDASTISESSAEYYAPATGSILINVTTPSSYMTNASTFALSSAMDWTSYKTVSFDIYVATPLSTSASVYSHFAIGIDGGSGTSAFYTQDPSATSGVSNSGTYLPSAGIPLGTWLHLSYPLNWSVNGLSPSSITRFYVVPSIGTPSAGTYYIDNLTLHSDSICPSATPTRTPTPNYTATPTATPTSDCPFQLASGTYVSSTAGSWTEGGTSDTSVSTIFLNSNANYIESGYSNSVGISVTTASSFMGNVSAYAPASAENWSNYDAVSFDVYIASPLSATGSTYGNFSIRVESNATTGFESDPTGGYVQPATGSITTGSWLHMSFPLEWATTSVSPLTISKLYIIPNVGSPTASVATYYLENVVLHTGGTCPSATPTFTVTRTATISPSNTPSPAGTPTNTPTNSPTYTIAVGSPTNTPTITETPSASPSGSPSATGSPSGSPSVTETSSPVPGTPTPTFSVSPAYSPTSTSSPTPVLSPTPSGSATVTPSVSPSYTVSGTPSYSGTLTASGTVTLTPSQSPTPSGSPTATSTATASNTPSITQTWTQSAVASGTATATATPTATATSTVTVTATATPDATAGVIGAASATATPLTSLTSVTLPSGPIIIQHSPFPNPNPIAILVELGMPVDFVEVRIYAENLVYVGCANSAGALPAGWQQVPLGNSVSGIADGVYYYKVIAHRNGGTVNADKVGKMFLSK
jgi:hypothetical protein